MRAENRGAIVVAQATSRTHAKSEAAERGDSRGGILIEIARHSYSGTHHDGKTGFVQGCGPYQDYWGVNILADAVKVMLGPRVRNVILNRTYGPPLVANFGVIVAKETELKGKFGNMGAQMIKEVAATIVTRSALQDAASIASLIPTTDAMVAELPKDEEQFEVIGEAEM